MQGRLGLDSTWSTSALDGALHNGDELSLGSEGWSHLKDPLLGDTERH
ncbi:hypothetical protein ABZ069_30485 [Streptomyces microflavus]